MSDYCEQYLASAKNWIGKETKIKWGRYPVEREPIRRWCHMANCLNPLYLDAEYSRKTKWGGLICPPMMIPIFARAGWSPSSDGPEIDWPPVWLEQDDDIEPPTPGKKGFVLGATMEFFKVVRIGDTLGSKEVLKDVFIKAIRFDPESFWITREQVFVNQYLDTVAVRTVTGVKHREPGEIKPPTP